jgi:hypothetical protein
MSTDSQAEERIDSARLSERELVAVYTIEGIEEKA